MWTPFSAMILRMMRCRALGFALMVWTGVWPVGATPRASLAWTYHAHPVPPNERAAHIAAFECTPVLAGSLLYLISPFNQVMALDPATGEEKWRFDPHVDPDRAYSEASSRGVLVSNGVVYFGTLDARLIALNASDGKFRWQTEIA